MYEEIKKIDDNALLGDFNVQGLRFVIYDTYRINHKQFGKSTLGYYLFNIDGSLLFHGEDFYASPCYSIDSYETFASLLNFLTLRIGDTDREYFDNYSENQLDFANSSLCEQLSCDLSVLQDNEDHEDFNYENFFINWEN